MKFIYSIVLMSFLLIGFSNMSMGQLYLPEDLVRITGQAVDSLSRESLANVQVLNFRVHGGTMTDSEGKFSIQADPSDTLTFKLLGYEERKIPVKEFIDGKENQKIALKVIRYAIPGVEVKGKAIHMNFGIGGKENPLPAELRSEDFASKPTLLSAVFKPLAFMHYKLSKSEKEKRAMIAAIYSERDWQILSLVYNKDVIQRLTSLTGDDLDDFMLYCNAYSDFRANATTYEVHKKIKELFDEYKKTHPLKGQ
jgi:hypothetical protein